MLSKLKINRAVIGKEEISNDKRSIVFFLPIASTIDIFCERGSK